MIDCNVQIYFHVYSLYMYFSYTRQKSLLWYKQKKLKKYCTKWSKSNLSNLRYVGINLSEQTSHKIPTCQCTCQSINVNVFFFHKSTNKFKSLLILIKTSRVFGQLITTVKRNMLLRVISLQIILGINSLVICMLGV